jgi:methyl-accepting chemotaxis protein
MSLKFRLFATLLANIGFCAFVGLAALWATYSLGNSSQELVKSSVSIRNHLEGDMMHDAIRGDVLKILLQVEDPSLELGAVKESISELKEHSEHFKELIEENTRLLSNNPKLTSSFNDVKPVLENYIESANQLAISAEKGDKYAAISKLSMFMKAFESLEEQMENVSEQIEAEGKKIDQESQSLISKFSIGVII